MLSERAFRAQLVTQGQRELYDYWRQSAGSRRMPARSDINPFSVPKLLPCIGLIDLTEGSARPGSDWRARGSATSMARRSPASVSTGSLPALAPTIGRASMPGWRTQGSPLHGVVRGPAPGPRPYRLVLVAVAALAGRDQGRQDPLLRHGGPYRGCSRAGRTPPSPRAGAAAADVDRAAAGAVRLGRTSRGASAKLGFIGRHQPKVTIELVAPMAGKRTPALGAKARRSFDRISRLPSGL